MLVGHILRKYDPSEWGGTEAALYTLMRGLNLHGTHSTVYCPQLKKKTAWDPLAEAASHIERFSYFLPVSGLSQEKRQRLVAIGGNIVSFSLPILLLREAKLSLIHTHTFGVLGATALRAAQMRGIPLVASIHGGILDLPPASKANLLKPLEGAFNWGRIFSPFLNTRHVLKKADAIVAYNKTEAALLKAQYPAQQVAIHPHAISAQLYEEDCRPKALQRFPFLANKKVLLIPARIDPVKNQLWALDILPELLKLDDSVYLLMAGSATDETYAAKLKSKIRSMQLERHAGFSGFLPPCDPVLIGLFQIADTMLLPSVAEPFGLVILEAWASGAIPICSRTSGPEDLIRHGQDGWLFDLDRPADFIKCWQAPQRRAMAALGKERVFREYEESIAAKKMQLLYDELTERKR